MKRKQAALIINPRAGQNVAHIEAIQAILEAAGWNTDLALKEYGGHTMELATRAAEKEHDLIIAYGGDGTLNQVVNGVLHTQKQRSTVGLIPGGTANVWASEIGIPADPVEAALALVGSQTRTVDVGHVEVEGLYLPASAQAEKASSHKKARKKRPASKRVRQHFLLMAGLGIDAAVMGHVSKPLKYRVGVLAVGASTAKELPEHRPFPVEIWAGEGNDEGIHWKGEALQVVIGNTRLYADIVQMTPDAHIDDGQLDVCVITAGNPLTTMQQLASLLLRHHPDNVTAEYFQGAHFALRVPASVALQLDGSAMKLKNYLCKSDRQALAGVDEPEQVMVTYRFDALPGALPVAIPQSYKGVLFEENKPDDEQQTETSEPSDQAETPEENQPEQHEEHKHQEEQSVAQVQEGRSVTVAGVSPRLADEQTTIVAGTTTKQSTGENRPVALRVDATTQIKKSTGEPLSLRSVEHLPAGHTLTVKGKKNRRGVIKARQITLP